MDSYQNDFFSRQSDVSKLSVSLRNRILFYSGVSALLLWLIVAGVVKVLTLYPLFHVPIHWWNWQIICGVAVFVLIHSLVGWFYGRSLFGSTRHIQGNPCFLPVATRIDSDTLEYKEVLQLIEELSIAIGINIPKLYVVADDSINACVEGNSISDVSLCITKGALTHLSREELQCLVSISLFRALNGTLDIYRYCSRLLPALSYLYLVGLFCKSKISARSVLNPEKMRFSFFVRTILFLFVIFCLMCGCSGAVFSRFIQRWLMRVTTGALDEEVVSFLGKPEAFISLFTEIKRNSRNSTMSAWGSINIDHYFVSKSCWIVSDIFFPVHKSCNKRMKLLKKSIVDTQISTDKIFNIEPFEENPTSDGTDQLSIQEAFVSDTHSNTTSESANNELIPVQPEKTSPSFLVVEVVGRPKNQHLSYAVDIMNSLPEKFIKLCRHPIQNQGVLLYSLLDANPDVRALQLLELYHHMEYRHYKQIIELLADIPHLQAHKRYALHICALSGLATLSKDQFENFMHICEIIVTKDSRIDLFINLLQYLMVRYYRKCSFDQKDDCVTYSLLEQVKPLVVELISLLAWDGNVMDEEKAMHAFKAAIRQMDSVGVDVALSPIDIIQKSRIAYILDDMSHASAQVKKQIISICSACVAAKGNTSGSELQIMRALCNALDSPVSLMV